MGTKIVHTLQGKLYGKRERGYQWVREESAEWSMGGHLAGVPAEDADDEGAEALNVFEWVKLGCHDDGREMEQDGI